jgi:hypothetical protein
VQLEERWIYRRRGREARRGSAGARRRGRQVGQGVWFEGSKRVNAVLKKRSPVAWLKLPPQPSAI